MTGEPADLAAAVASGYRCPDCDADAALREVRPLVYVLDVAHDDTCPTLARLEGDAR
ncbi:MAG: hypothetical protein H0U48_06995 [Euzebyaceae bacterium]|nr:hypothetical protein [Euzebyaceae bacterium]